MYLFLTGGTCRMPLDFHYYCLLLIEFFVTFYGCDKDKRHVFVKALWLLTPPVHFVQAQV